MSDDVEKKDAYGKGDRCGLDASYEVVRLISKGGMGEVYEVVHLPSARRYALKRLQFRHKQNRTYLEKLQAEAAAGQEMKHPNLVPVYESALDELGGYFVMELLHGKTLSERLWHGGKMAPVDALDACAQIADALYALHVAGIVHRDVKPGNIFLTQDGRVLLLDLGAAKFERYGLDTTQSQGPLGTALYMSPEHARNERVDGRSDVYSLGHVLYHALAGQHAFEFFGERFETASSMNIVMWHATEEVPSLVSTVPDLPKILWDVVRMAVRRQVDQRYASAADFAAAMRGAAKVLGKSSGARERQLSPAHGPKGTVRMMDAPPVYTPPPPVGGQPSPLSRAPGRVSRAPDPAGRRRAGSKEPGEVASPGPAGARPERRGRTARRDGPSLGMRIAALAGGASVVTIVGLIAMRWLPSGSDAQAGPEAPLTGEDRSTAATARPAAPAPSAVVAPHDEHARSAAAAAATGSAAPSAARPPAPPEVASSTAAAPPPPRPPPSPPAPPAPPRAAAPARSPKAPPPPPPAKTGAIPWIE